MVMLAEQYDFVIGGDPDRDTIDLAVVDTATGVVRAHRTDDANGSSCGRLLDWAREQALGRRVWALEGTGSFAAGLATMLGEAGEDVVEVGGGKRTRGAKYDRIDAVRAARTALAREHQAVPRARGLREGAAAEPCYPARGSGQRHQGDQRAEEPDRRRTGASTRSPSGRRAEQTNGPDRRVVQPSWSDRRSLLTDALGEDDGVVRGDDLFGYANAPPAVPAGRWCSRCRGAGRRVGLGFHSAVTSATAARADDSSTMAFLLAKAATRA